MSNIPILMYHSISDCQKLNPLGRLSFSSAQFRTHLSYLRKNRFECITLDELYRRAVKGEIDNKRIAVITFDDGFLDNLTVAQPILEDFGFKGTVFVNPDRISPQKPNRQANKTHWGQLSYPELIEMENNGVMSIQSHTMTHDFLFRCDKVIDFYSPQKYSKYYWLGNLLFPEDKPNWMNKIEEQKNNIPVGYPIFEYGRALTTRKFSPDGSFIYRCINEYSKAGAEGIALANSVENLKGTIETEAEYKIRAKGIVCNSKTVLEQNLSKDICAVCFPGGAYNDYVLSCVRECGYKIFMRASKDCSYQNNIDSLKDAASDKLIGLKRISITKDYPISLQNSLIDYINCKLKIQSFMEKKNSSGFLQILRFARNLTHLLKKQTGN